MAITSFLIGMLVAYTILVTLAYGRRVGMDVERKKNMKMAMENLEKFIKLDDPLNVRLVVMEDDIKAILKGTHAIVGSMSEIKDVAQDLIAVDMEHTPEFYIAQLEYARDKFAKTKPQKKTINSIISIVKSHVKLIPTA